MCLQTQIANSIQSSLCGGNLGMNNRCNNIKFEVIQQIIIQMRHSDRLKTAVVQNQYYRQVYKQYEELKRVNQDTKFSFDNNSACRQSSNCSFLNFTSTGIDSTPHRQYLNEQYSIQKNPPMQFSCFDISNMKPKAQIYNHINLNSQFTNQVQTQGNQKNTNYPQEMMDRNGPTKKTDTSSYGFDFYGINVSAAQNLQDPGDRPKLQIQCDIDYY